MFKSLETIESSFRKMRLMMIVFIILCAIVCIVTVVWAFDFANKQRQKIYVLDQGKSLMLALAQDVNQNRPVEARDHVKRFHELFFTLSPDQKAIDYTIRQALYLADESANTEYRNLIENGYFNNLIAGNVSQKIQIDSIKLDMQNFPYSAQTYATQTIIRSSTVTTRNLISHCFLRDVQRSDNNPHGFLIERWRVKENKDITTVQR
ncbi:conjugative transposon protein TraK [Pedobacter superstes]|uniref:conjugative transposon protein TraK n=1 Tax=Pedobacter superstes TaxID=3133441 RepID=UPI003D70E03B